MERFDEIVKVIVCRFLFAYQTKCKGIAKKDVYCGITDNLKRRQSEHNVATFVYEHECDSFTVAKAVEERLHNCGFCTGGQLGNGTEDSVFVYMYVMGPNTKP